jgi:acylphosphatase
MKVINNQDKVANLVNKLGIVGVNADGDDGSVCIQVKGDRANVIKVAKQIMNDVGDLDTGDGVQKGGMFVNGDDCNIHDDLYLVANYD